MTTTLAPAGTPDLVAHVRARAERLGWWARGETIVVGVSGGADSVALIDILASCAPELDLRLVVAHLDHALRPASADDAAFVASLAQRYGLPSELGARDTARLAAELGRGLEDAARAARYAFLARAARRHGAAAVAVGHTAEDQAETVLLNLLRGTGADGLRGMSALGALPSSSAASAALDDAAPAGPVAARPPRLVRPLLDVPRAELRAHLASRGLTWREDPSNRDLRFVRNRIRHEVMPALEAINPGVGATIARTAAIVAEDMTLIEQRVDAAWLTTATPDGSGVTFDLGRWSAEPLGVRRRLVRRAVAHVRGDATDLTFDHVGAVIDLASAGRAGASVHLPGGMRAEMIGGVLRLASVQVGLPPPQLSDRPVPLRVPGETRLPGGWCIHATCRARQEGDGGPSRDRFAVSMDADLVAEDLAVRARRAGDRLQPLGLAPHHRSLQDLFVDARIPRRERDAWPVVVCRELVAWVPGVRLDARVAVRPGTTRVVRLSVRGPSPGATVP